MEDKVNINSILLGNLSQIYSQQKYFFVYIFKNSQLLF